MIDFDSCVLWLDSRYFSESYWWDRSKYKNDGVVTNAKFIEDGFYFNKTDAKIVCADHPTLRFTDAFSIETVIKVIDPVTPTWGMNIVRKNISYTLSIEDYPDSSHFRIKFYTWGNSTNNELVLSSFDIKRKYHIVCTFGDGKKKIVVNGKIKTETDWEDIIRTPGYDVLLGGRIADSYWYSGYMYLFRLYSKELSEEEIDILTRNVGI